MKFIITEDFKFDIKIDEWDAWNADWTIGVIIHHVLKEMKRQGTGCGKMEYEDVPEQFHDEWNDVSSGDHNRGYSHGAWSWMIDEIIWATQPKWDEMYFNADTLRNGSYKEHTRRKNHAMELFGKYYSGFWN